MNKSVFRSFVASVFLTSSMPCFSQTDFEHIRNKWNAYLSETLTLIELERQIELKALNHHKYREFETYFGKKSDGFIRCDNFYTIQVFKELQNKVEECSSKQRSLWRVLDNFHSKMKLTQYCSLPYPIRLPEYYFKDVFEIAQSLRRVRLCKVRTSVDDSKVQPSYVNFLYNGGPAEYILKLEKKPDLWEFRGYELLYRKQLRRNLLEYFEKVKSKASKEIEEYLTKLKPILAERVKPEVVKSCKNFIRVVNRTTNEAKDLAKQLFVEYDSIDDPFSIYRKFARIVKQQSIFDAFGLAYSKLPEHLKENIKQFHILELLCNFSRLYGVDRTEKDFNRVKYTFKRHVIGAIEDMQIQLDSAINSYLNA